MAFTPFQAGDELSRAAVNQAISGVEQAVTTIPQEIEPVGTIKQSAKKTLGSNWILCNGDQVTSAQYPELFPQLSARWEDRFSPFTYGAVTSYSNARVKYLNGYWFIFYYASDSAYLLYSSDTVTWTKKTVYSGTSTSQFQPFDMVYIGGKYVLVGYHFSGQLSYAAILSATSPSGTFTLKDIGRTGTGFSSAAVSGSYLVVSGSDNNNPFTAVLNSSLSLVTSYNGSVSGVVTYVNGYWFRGSSGTLAWYCNAAYPASAAAWTQCTTPVELRSVIYEGGKYYFGSSYGVYTAASIAGGYTQVIAGRCECIVKAGTSLLAIGTDGSSAAYAASPFNAWTTFKLSIVGGTVNSVAVNGDTVLAIRSSGNPLGGTRAYGRKLPTISPDLSYAYIKARSGT